MSHSETKPIATRQPPTAVITTGMSRELRSFIEDLEELINPRGIPNNGAWRRDQGRLNARFSAAKESLAWLTYSLSQQLKKSASLTHAYVHQQPWQSMAGVALLAFGLARVISPRRPDQGE